MKLYPIVLFAYNRPVHTKKTIELLSKNLFANQSILYVFCDGPKKNNSDINNVKALNSYLKTVDTFKKIIIKNNNHNKGLAKNILDGLNFISNKYEAFIVLEDDVVTSKYFLKYMNLLLNKYKNNKKIFHINAWAPPVKFQTNNDIFFQRMMFCWGWATWSNRWQFFTNDFRQLDNYFDTDDKRNYASLNNNFSIWRQYYFNKFNLKTTWAVFWYLSIIKNNGLCISFRHSLTNNIGLDGSGTNCSKTTFFNNNVSDSLNELKKLKSSELVEEDNMVFNYYYNYFSKHNNFNLQKKCLDFIFRFIDKIFNFFRNLL